MLKDDLTVDDAIEASYMSPSVFTELDLRTLVFLKANLENWLNLVMKKCPQSKERDRIMHQCSYTLTVVKTNIKGRAD